MDWKSGTMKTSALLGVVGSLFAAAYINLATQTAVAIDVAQQHGQELLMIRTEVAELRGTVLAGMDDRFRRADFDREKEFLLHRLEELESRVARLER